MASPDTYRPILTTLCEQLAPRRILEWGPGDSTILLANACPQANILSIEHDVRWYERIRQRTAASPRIEIAHVPHMLPLGRSAGYVTYPLRRLLRAGRELAYYDLIFVDGRSRCDCLTVAWLLLATRGVVVLHDAERSNYHDGLHVFPAWLALPDIGVAVAAHDASAIPKSLPGCGKIIRRQRDDTQA